MAVHMEDALKPTGDRPGPQVMLVTWRVVELSPTFSSVFTMSPDLHTPVPDEKVQRYLVYLKYWTLTLRPLMVYTKVLFHPRFIIKDTHPLRLVRAVVWGPQR